MCEKEYFKTDEKDIWVNVKEIITSKIKFWHVYIENAKLRSLIINRVVSEISGEILVISNFGIVDGHTSIFDICATDKFQRIRLYEFRDVYKFLNDRKYSSNLRLKKIFEVNELKYDPSKNYL